MSNKNIFDLESIACEDCERYWDSSCNGHKYEAPCRSFKAALKYDIPKRLKKLESDTSSINVFCWFNFAFDLLVVIYMLVNSFY